MTQPLTLDRLREAVRGDCAAIRAVTRLQSAGGPGDKVFPPTYLKESKATTKYAFEIRRVDGVEVSTVVLDSVPSQANRIEHALIDAFRLEELAFPVIEVDFRGVAGLEDLDRISTLEAPHRVADAVLRDSLLDGVPFRYSALGQAVTEARPTHATAMFTACPTGLSCTSTGDWPAGASSPRDCRQRPWRSSRTWDPWRWWCLPEAPNGER